MGREADSLSRSSHRRRNESYGSIGGLRSGGSVPLLSPTSIARQPTDEKYSFKKKLVFFNFNLVNFTSAMCVSLQSPFYPQEAESKGATPSEYGFVFGCFELVVFIMSPFYGKYMRQIGPKFMMNAGIFVTSICCIIFGFLNKTPPGKPFLVLSFIIRIIQAMGEAGFITASNTMVVRDFSESRATTFAIMKTSFGFGLIVGPTVGGVLYGIGGFTLPFVVIGSIMFIAGIVTYFLLPSHDDVEDEPTVGGKSFLSAFRVPAVLIASCAVTSTSISIGFTQALLEPHVRQFKLPPTLTGFMFIINGGVYALTSPIWGRLCDKLGNAKLWSAISAVFLSISFLFLGPAPFFPFDTKLWLCVVALAIQGVGIGGELVAAYVDAMQDVVNYGFPDNLDTYGVVNGIWNSLFALGAFLGPSIGGILYDKIGFRNSTVIILVLHIIVALLFFITYCMNRSRRTGNTNNNTYDIVFGSNVVGSSGPVSEFDPEDQLSVFEESVT